MLGAAVDDKDFLLDTHVGLIGKALNLEMQVINEGNWPERSMSYLCRLFDRLRRGDDYLFNKAAYQFAFLDFTLFEDVPEFFARYGMLNFKNHRLYTDKFLLGIVDLTQIDIATEEDKAGKLDVWAKFFKAKTWEELRMYAKEEPIIARAASGMRQMTEDEMLRETMFSREQFYAQRRYEKRERKRLENELDQAIEGRKQAEEKQQQEIEKRKQAEEKLQQAEEDMQRIVEELEVYKKKFKDIQEEI